MTKEERFKQLRNLRFESKMKSILPESVSLQLDKTFKCMDIAEDEIKRFKLKYPKKQDQIFDSFQFLCPTPILRDKGYVLYRQHCKELLNRIVKGGDVRPGTNAEIIAALSNLSLIAPLASTYAGLYDKLFREMFPDEAVGKPIEEFYKGAYNELYSRFQKKLSCERSVR